MIIDKTKKFVFVHIPKTAGSSITISLGRDTKDYPTHTIARDVDLTAAFSFAFVRNPWDRMYSLYNFICQKHVGPGEKKRWSQQAYINMGFKKFILDDDFLIPAAGDALAKKPIQREPQLTWIANTKNEILIDYVGRFEKLQDDFNYICKKTNTKSTLGHQNKTKHGSYREAYDNEMIDFITTHHKIDIDTFGYGFE